MLPITSPISLTDIGNCQADMLRSSVAQVTITGRENQRSTNESSVPPVPRPAAVPNPKWPKLFEQVQGDNASKKTAKERKRNYLCTLEEK